MTLANHLTRSVLAKAAAELADRDPDLGRVVRRLGPPPLWDREPGFRTLVHIILEQQVSLASARAAFNRLQRRLPVLDPQTFLTLDDAILKEIGFSGQKGRYCRNLSRAVRDGSLQLDLLLALSEEEVCADLTRITGIGPWTAQIYLLMALRRPDVWPTGDLALAAATQDIKGLEDRPGRDEQREIAEGWRPWRSVAARILWFHYLNPEG